HMYMSRRVDSSQSWTPREPWVLGQVCSYWRSQALALPTLWSSISFSTSPWPRELSLCHTQLARSGTAPLDLLIRFTVEGGRDRTEVDKFMAKLVSFKRSLAFAPPRIHTPLSDPPSFFASLGPNPLPLLEEVVLGGVGIYIGDKQKFSKIDLGVVSADLGVGYLWRDVLTLPRLRRLVISHPVILNCLAAPALKSLYIIGPVEHVLPFLRRSGCTETLSALTLTQYTVPAPELIGLLHDTPGSGRSRLISTSPLWRLSRPSWRLSASAQAEIALVGGFDDKLERDAFADMSAGWRLRLIPNLDVPAVKQWRDY
ncbi:hypothetical protein B0H14DRAFT_2832851, partial [Mycena olivaceomarginata]